MTEGSALFDAKAQVSILYGYMDKGQRSIDIPGFRIDWHYGEQRLTDGCKDQVLTIEHYEVRRGHNKRAIAYAFAETIIRGRYPMPRIPIAYLHFKAPPFNLTGVLMQLHFNPYRLGQRQDYWHVVDGQGELL